MKKIFIYKSGSPSGANQLGTIGESGETKMKRMAWVTGIKPEMIETYRRLHEAAWPDVLAMISACNIRNYSIFLREPENILFGVFDYIGSDYEADAARMAQDPKTREWWLLTDPCQIPLASAEPDQNWAPMQHVFYHD